VVRKKTILFTAIALVILISLVAVYYGQRTPERKMEQPRNTLPQKAKSSPENDTAQSGVVNEVPWVNDADFKKARETNRAFKKMVAFRTVLINPLPGEEENVHLAARMLAGTVLAPGQVFSQNAAIGPYSKERGFQEGPVYIGSKIGKTIGGGVCKIASTLYNVTVLSNLEVVERHAHRMPVPYVPYGRDATVSYGSNDYKFRNNTAYPILIWARGIDNKLYIAFYSQKAAPRVEWHHKVINRQQAPTTYEDNQDLPAGTERVLVKGMDGALISSWVTIREGNGKASTKMMGQSHYIPITEVVERGV
jgi:vancomycin resistance protein YoaR